MQNPPKEKNLVISFLTYELDGFLFDEWRLIIKEL